MPLEWTDAGPSEPLAPAHASLAPLDGLLRLRTIVDALLERLQAVRRDTMPRIPTIPKQVTLFRCQPPGPPVPDWETFDETVRTAVEASLARLIERIAIANEDGPEHE